MNKERTLRARPGKRNFFFVHAGCGSLRRCGAVWNFELKKKAQNLDLKPKIINKERKCRLQMICWYFEFLHLQHDQDGFDVLYKRTDGVLDTCKDISSFYRDLGKIEREYGKSLGKLAKEQKRFFEKASLSTKEYGYFVLTFKISNYKSSTDSAWGKVLAEIERAGQHHEALADKMTNELCKSIENYIKEKQKTKKKVKRVKIRENYQLYEDGHLLTKEWKAAQETLSKVDITSIFGL
jgi:hypothetical protein